VEHGRTTLNLFRDYLTELNQLVEGRRNPLVKVCRPCRPELVPERFRSLSNQDFGQNFSEETREALLGLSTWTAARASRRQGVEQVYYYYAKK